MLIVCINRKKIEGFANQLIIPQFEFAILTPKQDIRSGYFQEEICRDDPSWKKGNKICQDYSLQILDLIFETFPAIACKSISISDKLLDALLFELSAISSLAVANDLTNVSSSLISISISE